MHSSRNGDQDGFLFSLCGFHSCHDQHLRREEHEAAPKGVFKGPAFEVLHIISTLVGFSHIVTCRYKIVCGMAGGDQCPRKEIKVGQQRAVTSEYLPYMVVVRRK